MSTKFKNFTPHTIVLNDGRTFLSEGLARVSATHSAFDADGVASVEFGEVTGLPTQEPDVLLIVSAMVVAAAKGRNDLVGPATGHPDTVRKDGQIVSVPGFIRA